MQIVKVWADEVLMQIAGWEKIPDLLAMSVLYNIVINFSLQFRFNSLLGFVPQSSLPTELRFLCALWLGNSVKSYKTFQKDEDLTS